MSADIQDPFVRKTVHVGRWDLLRGLLRRELVVEVARNGSAGTASVCLMRRPPGLS